MTDPTPPDRTPSTGRGPRDVEYKGAPLDAERGPGLGCFWTQLAVLVVLLVLTPLSVQWGWSPYVSGALLVAVLVLLLISGQTIIFLLRLVAADRRATGRRRPLASQTKTVGELEDDTPTGAVAKEPGNEPRELLGDPRGDDPPSVPE